uniref:NADH-ubiquinone oxidoreductase chain 1 n=1 Tax=Pallisentis celatus TaxID=935648 RepID=V5IXC0_PALCE|nr:NADH dehydrogenase subunit 1 [Pallisentis celatus]AFK50140.1 NADH dehydrogenase subunit 1 [Pallisentis celatus]
MRYLIGLLLSLSLVLLSVAFFTLLDRKVLAFGQLRKGPNKIFFLGVVQPLVDGVKLFVKNFLILKLSSMPLVVVLGFVLLVMMMACWLVISSGFGLVDSFVLILVLMVLTGGLVVVSFSLGVAVSSGFSLLGVIRSVVQMVSYEVVLGFAFIVLVSQGGAVSVLTGIGGFMGFFLIIMVIFSVIMEVNRTPFDFIEGESELVAGMVTEFGGLIFSFIFMVEYGMMLFYSIFLSWLVCGGLSVGFVFFLVGLFSWLRLSFPRFRYDMLVMVGWKVFMPSVMLFSILWWAGLLI